VAARVPPLVATGVIFGEENTMKRLGLNRALLMTVLTLTALAISALAVSATGRAARPDRTLHVVYGDRLLTLDPQAAYDGIDWQILYATCV